MRQIGLVGLGKMGSNLALNMVDHGYEVLAHDLEFNNDIKEYITQFETLEKLVEQLESPKVVWVMVPCGEPTNNVIKSLSKLLPKGSVVVDGGNTYYKDTLKHHEILNNNGIHFLDVGTSGGIEGARNGACLMIGGDHEAYQFLENLFSDIAVEGGFLYTGAPSSGHYLKMVHNGIEYGMMQAIGEGLEVLNRSPYSYDMEKVTKVWSNGSVIRGWLIELMHEYYKVDPNLSKVIGVVDASGEAEWTVESALELKVSVPVIAASLFSRYESKDDNSYSNRVVASLRNQFGGHKIYKK